MKTYTNREVEELAQIALDAACFAIQEKLDQEDGGIAGMYFSGVTEDVVMSIFTCNKKVYKILSNFTINVKKLIFLIFKFYQNKKIRTTSSLNFEFEIELGLFDLNFYPIFVVFQS